MAHLLTASAILLAASCTPGGSTTSTSSTSTSTTTSTSTSTTTTRPVTVVATVTIQPGQTYAIAPAPGTLGLAITQYVGTPTPTVQVYPVETAAPAGCTAYGVIPITDVEGYVVQNGVITPLGPRTSSTKGQWWFQPAVSLADGAVTVDITVLTVGSAPGCVTA